MIVFMIVVVWMLFLVGLVIVLGKNKRVPEGYTMTEDIYDLLNEKQIEYGNTLWEELVEVNMRVLDIFRMKIFFYYFVNQIPKSVFEEFKNQGYKIKIVDGETKLDIREKCLYVDGQDLNELSYNFSREIGHFVYISLFNDYDNLVVLWEKNNGMVSNVDCSDACEYFKCLFGLYVTHYYDSYKGEESYKYIEKFIKTIS